jgi:hypothetical protein
VGEQRRVGQSELVIEKAVHGRYLHSIFHGGLWGGSAGTLKSRATSKSSETTSEFPVDPSFCGQERASCGSIRFGMRPLTKVDEV